MPRLVTNAAIALPEETTVRYLIDTRGSTFTVKASSTGLLSAFGHDPKITIREFWGEVEFVGDGSALQDAHMELHIRTNSLEVTDDVNDKDRGEIQRRMLDEVLESRNFPEILYACSRVTGNGNGDSHWLALNGELTLRGITRLVLVMTRVILGDSTLRASGEFLIRQSDFGIAPVTAVGGTIRLKDEVKCVFDIVARRQASTREE